jgi:hypothetical protein
MKAILYFLIAMLVAGAGYLAFERFMESSAADNTLAQAQGTPPPPARLPATPLQGAAPEPAPPQTVVTEVVEEQPAAEAPPPAPIATQSRSYEPATQNPNNPNVERCEDPETGNPAPC